MVLRMTRKHTDIHIPLSPSWPRHNQGNIADEPWRNLPRDSALDQNQNICNLGKHFDVFQ